ncbi:SagB/ThcOx family dehydrogenase, partial [Anaerosporobacter sp.]
NNNLYQLHTNTNSHRKYDEEAISLEELSFLLYATQGVKDVLKDKTVTLRNVPSGGAIHPFETYIYANNVSGLEEGLYHYLPIEHELEQLTLIDFFKETIAEAFLGQTFLTEAPVAFYWSIIPYRCEWKYASKAHRVALMDLGCVCQTLYLAAESISCGTCMVGAYDQEMADSLFGFDTTPGEKKDAEFLLGGAGVGRRPQ